MGVSDQGDVLARGNHILESYWEQPDATEAALGDGWFHTGDGGSIGEDGYVTISDRKKDVIISGGENVSSIEVEDALFSHDAVAEVAVIGVPDERRSEEHTSELQSLMRISYAVFCLKKKKTHQVYQTIRLNSRH